MKSRFIASLLAAAMASGCGGGDEAAGGPGVDTSDPMDVAMAFFEAVDRDDIDAAIEHVQPEQAADFREAMIGGMPDLPSDWDVIVMRQGDRARASISGTDLEVDMLLVDGRWWFAR